MFVLIFFPVQACHLDYNSATNDDMLELAMEHHNQRFWSMRRRNWLASAKLASRSVSYHLAFSNTQKFIGDQTFCTLLLLDRV